jgi:UDP-N-acetylmuramate dehydrogenase
MHTLEHVPLSELTTLQVGGPARRMARADTADEMVEAVAEADAAGEPVLVIAGGSNLVIADHGFDGVALRVAVSGIAVLEEGDGVRVEVGAGERWDDVVSFCVSHSLAGVECLSGIPGSTGATPIQNVGAYGQEVADTIASVRAYDRRSRSVVDLAPAECGFAYRSSAFKRSDRHVVLSVSFVLERSPLALPIHYAELGRSLGARLESRPALHEVRDAVLALRRRKGMVLDEHDPDSVSAGSFFVNPILSADAFEALRRRAADSLGDDVRIPAWPDAHGTVKTSAAWLIERAGFHRGYGGGRAGISSKHTLAIVNRGGATSAELVALAREMRDGVRDAFGVILQPEPTLIGISL